MDINVKLKKIIADLVSEDIDKITNETILTIDLGYDSVQFIELIMKLETEFNIVIEDEDLDIDKMSKYSNLHDMLSKKIFDN